MSNSTSAHTQARIQAQTKAHRNKPGYPHWKWQRLTAIALIPLSFWLMFSVLQALTLAYQDAQSWLGQGHVAIGLLLWLLFASWHAVLGLEVILEDYISDQRSRRSFIMITRTVLLVALILGVTAIIRLAL